MTTPTPTDSTFPTHGGDGTSQPASRTREMGQKAATAINDTINDKREAVASGLDSAASTVAEVADSTTAAMEQVADYVRDKDLQGMLSDVQTIVKRHPGATLLTAAALGFLLARSISRH